MLFLWTWLLIVVGLTNQFACLSLTGSKKEETRPQEMVNIIELMLSQRQNTPDKKTFGIQKVPQEKASSYEILITPNKNEETVKDSQKIKIYLDTTGLEPEKITSQHKNTVVQPYTDTEQMHIKAEALPLSIESKNGNADRYQRPNVDRFYSDQYDLNIRKSIPDKSQTTPEFEERRNFSKAKMNAQTENDNFGSFMKYGEIFLQKQPRYVDQNNPQHSIESLTKSDQQRTFAEENDHSFDSSLTISTMRSVHDENVGNYRSNGGLEMKKSFKPERSNNHDSMDDSVYSTILSSEKEKGYMIPNRERLGRNSETTAADNNDFLYSDKHNEKERSYYEIEEVHPVDTRIAHETEPEEVKQTNYRHSSNGKLPEYVEETNGRNFRNKGFVTDDVKYYEESIKDNNRMVRENNSGYSGFPESHQSDISNHYSRPLQYEPARAFPASPCLKVFKYEGREPEEDRWYADIYVTTDEVLNGMRLDISLDKPAELLTNWLSDVKTKDNIHFTLLSLNHKLMPGPPETVRIMVKFNGKNPVPYLKSINLNGRLICPSNRAEKTTTKRPEYENPGDLHYRRTTERYPENTKKPNVYVDDYDGSNKKTTVRVERRTTPLYEEPRKTTIKQAQQYHRPNPNPNGYEETDQNLYGERPKKPNGRPPPHSNGKPPGHQAQGHGHGHGNGHAFGHVHSNGNGHGNGKGSGKKPSVASPNLSKPPQTIPVTQDFQRPIECGVPSIQPSPLITHGQLTSRGQWPWHVALYKNVGTDLTFFCGGSLLNTKYVLTAAHCVTKTYTTKPLDENTLVVYLGKYHLKLWSEGGVQNRQVSKIYVHPKYNSTDFGSDIAVLALSTPVEYTDYIRPICMWDRTKTRIEDVEGRLGTVVGWGFDENKMLTEELRQAKMPVVEQKTCLWSYPDFYPQFTSNMTYCAGFKNGTSVCNGDSGGGMVFPFKDRYGGEKWHLRGIVSISPARNDSRVCDTSHYVVFTDVAKYLPWLDNFL